MKREFNLILNDMQYAHHFYNDNILKAMKHIEATGVTHTRDLYKIFVTSNDSMVMKFLKELVDAKILLLNKGKMKQYTWTITEFGKSLL